MKKATITLLLICGAVFAQQQSIFTDSRDGKKYKTVKIGERTWMAQNLNYHGEDGFLGLCYGDEPKEKIRKPENCKKYGRLYDWFEAMNACPKGWHLPSVEEWQTLVDFAGGHEVAGKKLKAKSGWEKPYGQSKCKWTEEKIDGRGRVTIIEYDKCNTDEYGFSALPGGGYYYHKQYLQQYRITRFDDVGHYGLWWSASEFNYYACILNMGYNNNEITDLDCNSYVKNLLFSVRCIQDNGELSKPDGTVDSQTSIPPIDNDSTDGETLDKNENLESVQSGTFIDQRNGKIYKTVKIGTQTYIAENLNYNASGSKCYGNNQANCEKYGRLYNWETAKNACPSGWHLPSKAEWDVMTAYIGGDNTEGKKLKARSGWNGNGNGMDNYGFSALPGGGGRSNGDFFNVGYFGFWWNASEYNSDIAYSRDMGYRGDVSWSGYNKSVLLSVRCLQD